MAVSPTSRALQFCRAQGWRAAVVEHWNSYAKIRQDLFGWIDLVVLDGEQGVLGVQVTSRSNAASRRTKILASDTLAPWLASGARAEVWSFAKQGPRGKRKVWNLKREVIESQ